MDEDLDVELRFVCKLCDKRFPSGKSLGGHMRSHVITASVANSTEVYDNGNSSANLYGLRENPKKSWRASSSSTLAFPNERICNQCGKKFQSLKALCGHMAFHSDKDRSLKDYDYSWTSVNLDQDKLIVDSDSGTEENEHQDPVFVTRSKSRRHSFGSSSVSEIDKFEQEQVAMCLMMLSKDSSNWVGVNSVLESNSGHCRTGIKGFNYKDLTYEEKQEIRRNLFREFGYDNSLKKRIRDDDDDDDGSYKKNKYECLNCNKTFSSFQGLGGHKPCHKKNNAIQQKAKLKKKIKPNKNKGHECPICYRMFESGQALGGHKRSHFINGSEDRIEAVATYKDMIDLNLPAPEED